jgi:hypothetical protein
VRALRNRVVEVRPLPLSGTGTATSSTSTTGEGSTSAATTGSFDTGPLGDPFSCDIACDCGPDAFCVQYSEGCGVENCDGGLCNRTCVSYPTCAAENRCDCLDDSVCPTYGECQDEPDGIVACDVPAA